MLGHFGETGLEAGKDLGQGTGQHQESGGHVTGRRKRSYGHLDQDNKCERHPLYFLIGAHSFLQITAVDTVQVLDIFGGSVLTFFFFFFFFLGTLSS